jgi:hypothetical protein
LFAAEEGDEECSPVPEPIGLKSTAPAGPALVGDCCIALTLKSDKSTLYQRIRVFPRVLYKKGIK